jgi:ketosteroid isomerase-like protein
MNEQAVPTPLPTALPSDPSLLLQVLKDRAEIERLVRTYADICDEDYDPERLGQLFTEDAVWAASSESGTSDFGVYEGRDAIKEFFAGVSAQIVFAHHIVMSPEIDVDVPGESATGRWNTMVWMSLRDDPLGRDGESKLISSVYRHRYRHTQDGWRIAHLHVHTRFDLRARQVG